MRGVVVGLHKVDAERSIYEEVLKDIPTRAKELKANEKLFAMGFSSNLDEIIQFDSKNLSNLLSRHEDEISIKGKQPPKLKTKRDFLQAVLNLFATGGGDELPIADEGLCKFIGDNFDTRPGVGGTASQGAMALSSLNFPALLHPSSTPAKLQSLISKPGIKGVNSQVKTTGIANLDLPETRYEPHFIFQIDENDSVKFGRNTVHTPKSNRLIMPYDKTNERIPINTSFLKFILQNPERVQTLSISGFNSIKSKSILSTRLKTLSEFLEKIEQQAPDIVTYLEDAAYHVSAYKKQVLNQLAAHVDVFSLNEEELSEITEMAGEEIDLDKPLDVIKGLEYLRNEYEINGVILHTKDYSAYFGTPMDCEIPKALAGGNLLASTKARTGSYAIEEELKETVRLPKNKRGQEYASALLDLTREEEIAAVPGISLDRTRSSVGLGDTFMAGTQIFLEV